MDKKITYKDAGVDLKKSDMLSEILSLNLDSSNFKNFSGLYEHPFLKEYYLAGTCDGIGTKIIPLLERGMIKTAAIDLIAMNLNDLACTGAAPLFFLDYIAANTIDIDLISLFIKELKTELLKYKTTLIGGETSELSDFIKKDLFDAAGFAVGIVKKDNLIGMHKVKKNDVLIGLKSSGPHSNGFSLIRRLYKDGIIDENTFINTLKPTVIYINEILSLCGEHLLHAAVNITGGGIVSNLKRVIPKGLRANVYKNNILKSDLFETLKAPLGEDEAYRTFNMGVGFIVISSNDNKDKVLNTLSSYEPFILGEVEENVSQECASVCLR